MLAALVPRTMFSMLKYGEVRINLAGYGTDGHTPVTSHTQTDNILSSYTV